MAEWAPVGGELRELYSFEGIPEDDNLWGEDVVKQFTTFYGYRCPIPWNIESWLYELPPVNLKTYSAVPVQLWYRTPRVRCTLAPPIGLYSVLLPKEGQAEPTVTVMYETNNSLLVGLKTGQLYSYSLKSLTKVNYYASMDDAVVGLAIYHPTPNSSKIDRFTLLLAIAGKTLRAYRFTTGGVYSTYQFDDKLVSIFLLKQITVATLSGDFYAMSFREDDSIAVEKIHSLDQPIHQVVRVYSDQRSYMDMQITPILVRFSSYLAVLDAAENIGSMHVMKKFRVPNITHGVENLKSKMVVGDYRLFFADLVELGPDGEPMSSSETTIHMAEFSSIDGDSYTKIVLEFGIIDLEVIGDYLLLSTTKKRVLVFNCNSLRLLFTILVPDYIVCQRVVNNIYIGGTKFGKLVTLPMGLDMMCNSCKEELLLPESPSNYVCIHAGQTEN